jgi:hypothetical protein
VFLHNLFSFSYPPNIIKLDKNNNIYKLDYKVSIIIMTKMTKSEIKLNYIRSMDIIFLLMEGGKNLNNIIKELYKEKADNIKKIEIECPECNELILKDYDKYKNFILNLECINNKKKISEIPNWRCCNNQIIRKKKGAILPFKYKIKDILKIPRKNMKSISSNLLKNEIKELINRKLIIKKEKDYYINYPGLIDELYFFMDGMIKRPIINDIFKNKELCKNIFYTPFIIECDKKQKEILNDARNDLGRYFDFIIDILTTNHYEDFREQIENSPDLKNKEKKAIKNLQQDCWIFRNSEKEYYDKIAKAIWGTYI